MSVALANTSRHRSVNIRGERDHSQSFTRQRRRKSPMMPQCSVTTHRWLYMRQCRSHLLRDSSKDFLTATLLQCPQDGRIRIEIWTLIMFVKWTSVSTCGWAFLLYFVNSVYTFYFFHKDKLMCPLFVIDVAAFVRDVLFPHPPDQTATF